jgi:hypothetical protein
MTMLYASEGKAIQTLLLKPDSEDFVLIPRAALSRILETVETMASDKSRLAERQYLIEHPEELDMLQADSVLWQIQQRGVLSNG